METLNIIIRIILGILIYAVGIFVWGLIRGTTYNSKEWNYNRRKNKRS